MSTRAPSTNPTTREFPGSSLPGFPVLAFHGLWIIAMFWLLGSTAHRLENDGDPTSFSWAIPLAILGLISAFIALFGYFTLQPNEARVQILFGSYKGTVAKSGFHWANPFYSRSRGGRSGHEDRKPGSNPKGDIVLFSKGGASTSSTKLSLRVHNFNSNTLKVNDKRGNPVEIAAVVVWRVADTAQAVFDVEDYKSYVEVQSESAIRGNASRYAYDHGEEQEPTLRGSADEVAHTLQEELQLRLAKAGVVVEEARLTHLAYAQEIASVMLRRQQAEAIVSARQQIVHGAVGMVRMALAELDSAQIVQLDPERRAAMVSNLLVVLCGNNDANPVINAGTLY
jgi:regulator of protease activity HflC (stomatin/prohibitin superfamily)